MSDPLPLFNFPSAKLSPKSTPWTLRPLLYRGGARQELRKSLADIKAGRLPGPLLNRLVVVERIHECLNADLVAGYSLETIRDRLGKLRQFYGFADEHELDASLESIVQDYCLWADSLVLRTQIKNSVDFPDKSNFTRLKANSAYGTAKTVAEILDKALDRRVSVLELTRIRDPRRKLTVGGSASDKLDQGQLIDFGKFLSKICKAIDAPFVRELPAKEIMAENGAALHIGQWSTRESGRVIVLCDGKRATCVSLRVEAELHLFISQTSMNESVAVRLKVSRLRYESHARGYSVSERKSRRKGDVSFTIYSEYRQHLEGYLTWRNEFFPGDPRLFPLSSSNVDLANSRVMHRIRRICKGLGIPYISARKLRGAKVNFLMASSVRLDDRTVTEIMQHSEQTLFRSYHRPSSARATVEIARFWKNGPVRPANSLAPGGCSEKPSPVDSIPTLVPTPDCKRTSGCLWCESHRDIDDFDYVWSLATFGRLKQFEFSVSGHIWSDESPTLVQLAIIKIRAKLHWIRQSSTERMGWVEEADERIAEGNWHPHWSAVMKSVEGRLWS